MNTRDQLKAAVVPVALAVCRLKDREDRREKAKLMMPLVQRVLADDGEFRGVFSEETERFILTRGDGKGVFLNWETYEAAVGGWDYSHVEESSPRGVEGMFNEILMRAVRS